MTPTTPEQIAAWKKAAEQPTVLPADRVLSLAFFNALTEAVRSEEPDPAAVEEAERLLPVLSRKLEVLAQADPADEENLSPVNGLWRQFYGLDMPDDQRGSLHDLLRSKGREALVLARVVETIFSQP